MSTTPAAAPAPGPIPTPLARAAAVPVPPADSLAGRFPLTPNPSAADDAARARALRDLHFGSVFTDHMAHARWTRDGGWGERGIIPFGDLSLSPAAAVLHYGQEIFEGIKAYRHDDGGVWTFRPRYNAARCTWPPARPRPPRPPAAATRSGRSRAGPRS